MSRLARIAACAMLALAASLAWAADEEATSIGGVEVVVWTPSKVHAARLAIVIFSHALYMCPTQSRYLTSVIADAGYLVVAPRHTDSSCNFFSWPSFSRMSLKPSPLWSDNDFRDRADDVRAVVDAISSEPRYRAIADTERLALVGHSLGGYTVLGLGGAWPSWRLRGVKAIVALTPYSLPFERSDGLARISAPIMYQTGTLDPIFTMPLERFGYARTPKPKFLVEFTAASHMAWTDLGMSDRTGIASYAIAFLDHFVKDAPEGAVLQSALPGVLNLWRD